MLFVVGDIVVVLVVYIDEVELIVDNSCGDLCIILFNICLFDLLKFNWCKNFIVGCFCGGRMFCL